MELQNLLQLSMELLGTVAFAISGAMVGIQCSMDVFGVCALGVTTAVGGGITRDIILGVLPSAFADPRDIEVAAVTSLLVFFVLYFRREQKHIWVEHWYELILLSMDSVGLGIFSVMGVMAGIRQGWSENIFLLVVLGTLTGVGGGLLRDTMAGVPPYIFVKHIYALASAAGALCYIYLIQKSSIISSMLIASALVVAIRFLAAHYRWNLPKIYFER